MTSAQGCRKPLSWLHREAISYLHPPSPQYRPMVQRFRGLPRSPSTRAEPTLLYDPSRPSGLPHGSGKLPCPAPGSVGSAGRIQPHSHHGSWCSGGSHACSGHPHLWGLACLQMGRGTPTALALLGMPPPHPARHPQGQQLHRTHSLASPSCELFPAAACAEEFQGSAQEVSEGRRKWGKNPNPKAGGWCPPCPAARQSLPPHSPSLSLLGTRRGGGTPPETSYCLSSLNRVRVLFQALHFLAFQALGEVTEQTQGA